MKYILIILTLLSLLAGCNEGPAVKATGTQASETPSDNFQNNAPSTFNILSATASNTAAAISWSTSSYAEFYELKYRAHSTNVSSSVQVYSTSYVLTGLTNGETYSVVVIAKNSNGQAQSNSVQISPAQAVPLAPVAQNLSVSISEDTERLIKLNYSDDNGDLATSCTVSNLTNITLTQPCTCTLGICKIGIKSLPEYFGPASFNFNVTNGLTSNTALASLIVTPVNDSPVAYTITPANISIGVESTISLPYTDIDNDLASQCFVSNVSNASVTTACSCGGGACTVGITSYTYGTGIAQFSYEVIANSSISNLGSATLSLTARPILSYAAALGTTIGLGSSFNVAPTLIVANGPAISSCTSSPALPAGISINPTTCVISGTPSTTMGTTHYTITATSPLGSSLGATVSLRVVPSAPILSYLGATGTVGTVGVAMSVTPTTLITNGTPITGCTVTPALPSWATLHPGTCVISGTPTSALSITNYVVTANNAAGSSTGATVTLSANAAPPTISYATSTGKTVVLGNALSVVPSTLIANGSAITSCSSTPSLPVWATLNPATCRISGTPTTILSATTYSITATNAMGSSSANVTLTVNPAVPTLSYVGSLGTHGAVGVPMSVIPTIVSANGSAISSCTSTPGLPAWAVLNANTCRITGTPTAVSVATTYTIRATNTAGTSIGANVTLSVGASAPIISYIGATGTIGSFGVPMSVSPTTLIDNGAAVSSCTVTPSLPYWATINPNTCVISGTPATTLPSTTYSVRALNSAGLSVAASVTLRVNALAPVISYAGASGTSGTFGVAMTVTPTTLNNKGAAISSCTSSPALPAWASINVTTCVISGTPNNSLSNTTYTITAVNSAGSTSTTVTLGVSAKVPTLSYIGSTGTTGYLNNPMSITPTTLNSNGSIINGCTASPALPSWATLNPNTCAITGTPDAESNSTYIITASNLIGNSSGAVVSIEVKFVAAPTVSYVGATGTIGTYGSPMVVTPTTLNPNGSSISTCYSSPMLPAWATLNLTTCAITGTPNTLLSATTFTITATNAIGSSSTTVSLTVNPAVPTLSYAGATGKTGSFGSPMSITPTTRSSNGASITSCTASPALPAGLTINPTTCVITGTPTVAAPATTYTITATNSAGPSTGSTLIITVNPIAPTLSYAGATGTTGTYGSAMSVSPTTIAANGASISSCTSSPGLPAWATLNSSTCTITGTPNAVLAATTYSITATNSAGTSAAASVTLSVNATTPSLSYSGAIGTTGAIGYAMTVTPTTLSDNGSPISSCAISPGLPGWASLNLLTCVISGTPNATLPSTTYTVTATNGLGTSTPATVTLAVQNLAPPTLSYSGATGTTGTFNVPMTVTPTTLIDNGAAVTTCTASPGLPVWATLNASTCVITGTPTQALSPTVFTITAGNTQGFSTGASVTLSVNAVVPDISYSGATGTLGNFGVAMSVAPTTLNANGAAISACTASPGLPGWATLNPLTCVISGTPNATLPATTYTITATNSAGTSTGATVTLTVNAAVPTISFAGAAGTSGLYGNAMSITPTTLNDNGDPVNNCTVSPPLPGWATLNPLTCIITGTPTSAQASTAYTITAHNNSGPSSGAVVNITVGAKAPTLSYVGSTGTNGGIGGAMLVTPSTFNNGGAALTQCNVTPALPLWANLNSSNCVISGTPDAPLPTTTYSITAVNPMGSSAVAQVTLSVDSDAPTLSYVGSLGTNGTFGVPMNVTPSAFNDNGIAIVSCTSTPALPLWATLSPTNCSITGTPDEASMATIYTIKATNSSGNFTDATVTISVAASAPLLSYSGADAHGETIGSPMTVTPTILNDQGSVIQACTADPILPGWASINATTCVITGTPPGNYKAAHLITVTNSIGSASYNLLLTAGQQVPVLSYSGSTGTTINYTGSLNVIPTTLEKFGENLMSCTASPALPAWITLDAATCTLTGTPNASLPTTTYTITAENSVGFSTGAALTLTVNAEVPVISYAGASVSGDIGVPMTVTPTTLIANGDPINGCTSSPALPAWLSLDINTCVITGTPSGALPATTFNITAKNNIGDSISTPVTISVDQAVPVISYAGATGTTAGINQAMTVTPTTLNDNGDPIQSCTVTPALPTGLSLNNTTCVISGTPTVTKAATNYIVTATNSVGPSNGAYVTLTINATAPTLSYDASLGTNGNIGVPMSVSPSTLNDNGANITNCTTSPALPTGLSLNPSNCAITGTPSVVTVASIYTISVTNSAGTTNANVTLSVGASAPQISYAGAAGTTIGIKTALSVTPTTLNDNGAAIGGCTASPGLPVWASIHPNTCVISGTPTDSLAATTYNITATNPAGSNTTTVVLTVNPAIPEISYGGAAITANMGTPVTITPTSLVANGATVTECIISPTLPAWAIINHATCEITGTPDQFQANTNYSASAKNSVGVSLSANFSLAINSAAPTLSYAGAAGTNGTYGLMMTVNPTVLTANGSAISGCTSSPMLPTWASLNATTCAITGFPDANLPPTVFNITVINGIGSTTSPVTLSVGNTVPDLSYSGAAGTTGNIGVAMNVAPTSLNQNGSAISNCTSTPSLPSGLIINGTTCVISGTPTGYLAATTFNITATNSSGTSAAAPVTLSVNSTVPTISYAGASGTNGTIGVLMTVSPTTLNDNGSNITACTATPGLPGWASINGTTCVISGTPPSNSSSVVYTITAENGLGTSTATVTLSVGQSVPDLSYVGSLGTNAVFGAPVTIQPTTLNTNGSPLESCTPTPSLPLWATLNQGTCTITGTPDTVQPATIYSIVAKNATGDSAAANVTISVSASAPELSYTGAAGTNGDIGFPMTVNPTLLNDHGAAIETCTISPALPLWASINATTCVISGTPDANLPATTYNVTVGNNVGSFVASVTLSAGVAVPNLSYAGAAGTTVEIDTAMLVTPTTLETNGSAISQCTATPGLPLWATLNQTTCEISGVPDTQMSATTYSIVAKNDSGDSAAASVTLTVTAGVPVLSYVGSPSSGVFGVPLTITPMSLDNKGSPITNCLVSPGLPLWATLNPNTCEITGTPDDVMMATIFTVQAYNLAGASAGADVTITISASAPQISYAGATGTSGQIGVAMTITPTTLNGNGAAISACTSTPLLPTGLVIDANTCVISGTPTANQAATEYTITATNNEGQGTSTISINVGETPPTLSYIGSTGTTINYNQNLNVVPTTLNENGATITNCQVVSTPAPPAWMTLDPITCVFSGIASETVDEIYTVVATNNAGNSDPAYVAIKVIGDVPELDYGAPNITVSVGTTINPTIDPIVFNFNGAAVLSCVSTPALADGLSIDQQTCIISGAPNVVLNNQVYSIVATNSEGPSDPAIVTITATADKPTLDYTGSKGFPGYINSAMTGLPAILKDNGSPITLCEVTPGLPTWATLNTLTCEITGIPDALMAPEVFTVTVTNSVGFTTANVTLEVKTCPDGFVEVPAWDDTATVPGAPVVNDRFCVMQYEAKKVGIEEKAVSQPADAPWTQITIGDAQAKCADLGYANQNHFDLISNQEWMSIARQVEAHLPNWLDDGVQRMLPTGNSNGNSTTPPKQVSDPLDPYTDTNDSAAEAIGQGKEQKRTLELANGTVIWDMAANAWEWVDWNKNTLGLDSPPVCEPANIAEEINEVIVANCPGWSEADYMPADPLLDSANGVGFFQGEAISVQMNRGGDPEEGGGIFTVGRENDLNIADPLVGFRCVFRP